MQFKERIHKPFSKYRLIHTTSYTSSELLYFRTAADQRPLKIRTPVLNISGAVEGSIRLKPKRQGTGILWGKQRTSKNLLKSYFRSGYRNLLEITSITYFNVSSVRMIIVGSPN